MLKLTLLACFVAPLICTAKAGGFHIPKQGHVFYVESDLKVTWQQALDACNMRNMNLLTPDTEKKQQEIDELISLFDLEYLWTAGREIADLEFMWATTGKIVTYANWTNDEPTRSGSETEHQCIGLYRNQWRSYGCLAVRNYVCEEKPNKNAENLDLDDSKATQSPSNEMQDLNASGKKIECDNTIITKLDALWNSHEKQKNNLLDEKEKEISDLKNQNEQYANELSVAKAQLQFKSIEIEMAKEFNEVQLRLREDKYKIYTGFVAGMLQVFNKLDKGEMKTDKLQ